VTRRLEVENQSGETYSIKTWHPHPETGRWMHVVQETRNGKRAFYTDGAKVLERDVDKEGLLIPGDEKLKEGEVLPL